VLLGLRLELELVCHGSDKPSSNRDGYAFDVEKFNAIQKDLLSVMNGI
jgi:hypothetical protein